MMRRPKAQQVNVLGDRFMPVAIPGLVAAYRIGPGLPPATLEPAEVAPALEAGGGWVWLHFALTDTLARAYIAKLEALPPEAREALLAAEDQLSIGRGDGVVFGNVADFERDLDADTEEVGRLRFAFTERLAVTGRRHPLRSLDELRQALHEGAGPATPGALIETVIDRFCDAVARTAARMSNELDRIEDHVVSDLVERERSRLTPVRRTAVRMHRQLASLAAILREHGKVEPEAEEGSPLR